MRFRDASVLPFMLLLAACATPGPYAQVPAPVGPIFVPKPMVLPSPPVILPPPAPLILLPPETEEGTEGKDPAPAQTSRRRPECEPIPVPHLGGDDVHNQCADEFPPNRFPGKDVLVDGKRFDALEKGAPVLWEIKTDRFDTYSAFLKEQVIDNQVPELRREFDIALKCGYGFKVGVSSAAHGEALRARLPELQIVVTGC